MNSKVSVSIDVPDMGQALDFYTQALGCDFEKKYSGEWQVVSLDSLDIHLQKKEAGTIGAGEHRRDYERHWTPVHLDFTVDDIHPVCAAIVKFGGRVESQSFTEHADIACCADPFGNGFCVIRE